MEMIRVPLRDRCRGRWHGILPSIGIDRTYLTGKNGPCPLCPGGRDRWRFLDSEGVGTWICTHCGSGNGIDLVMKFTGMDFREAAKRIETALGDVVPRPQRPQRDDRQIRHSLNSMWRTAAPIRRFDLVDQWFRSRGLVLEEFPRCLRTASNLRYYDSGGGGSIHPAMLAKVADPDGKPATIHRTYLGHTGGKAAVEKPRKIFSAMPIGGAVRLAAPAPTLGVAEGIETALAASILFNVPTWAAICAHGIATFKPPSNTRRLFIFADNDESERGQQAATSLASRMPQGLRTEIMVPEEPGWDWNDVLIHGGR